MAGSIDGRPPRIHETLCAPTPAPPHLRRVPGSDPRPPLDGALPPAGRSAAAPVSDQRARCAPRSRIGVPHALSGPSGPHLPDVLLFGPRTLAPVRAPDGD